MKKLVLPLAAIALYFGLTSSSCSKTDTTPPVIALTGQSTMTLDLGDTWTDPGATATDNTDGTITSSIVVSGTVNTSQVGIYTLTYSVSDAAGNSAQQTRTVTVRSNKLAGTYAVDATITGGPGAPGWTGTVTVTQSSTEYNKLIVSNFDAWGTAVSVNILVNGNTITVPSQHPSGVPAGSEGTASGSAGTYTVSGFAITSLDYTWTYDTGGPADVSHEVWTKQ